MMKVVKVLNNSLVLSTDSDNREVIVMGKGIGFNSKVGDVLASASIEKVYVVQNGQTGHDHLRLIEATPEQHIELGQMILRLANSQRGGRDHPAMAQHKDDLEQSVGRAHGNNSTMSMPA